MQVFRSPWWASLLGGRVTTVTVSKSGLSWKDNKGLTVTHPWGALSSVPEVHTGWLFAKVDVSVNDRLVELPRLSKRVACRLVTVASHKVWAFNAKLAKDACLRIEQRIPRQSYLRSSEMERISSQARSELSKLVRPAENSPLDIRFKRPFTFLRRWAEKDSSVISKIRQEYVERQLRNHHRLFENVESNPLTPRQREACVIDEDNNLVLAGAGTGKTSTMVGRAAYLLESNQASASEILMLAFGNMAAKEMQERITDKIPGCAIEASTFHALGRRILSEVEGVAPEVSPLAQDKKRLEKTVDTWFNEHLEERAYREIAVQYFSDYLYPAKNEFDFDSAGAYFDYIRANDIRTLQNEQVKSLEECLIANWLFRMGVRYEYESRYRAADTRTKDFRAYLPDFYLPDYDVYIEHFGIDREGRTAPYVDRHAYAKDRKWKKELHAEHGTRLVETFSYEHKEGVLLQELETKLIQQGVQFEPLPDEAMFATLKEFGAVTRFSELLCGLISNFKACNDPWEAMVSRAERCERPDQFKAALQLFKPILKQYENHLLTTDTIDFNDMIGRALRYVEERRYVPKWRFILVDEFQDISLGRARLVKALRDYSPNSCSLFCVGDDWQAIFRFAGSDVSLTMEFEKCFGPTQTTALDKTFRFNNKISEVASRFVMRNQRQVRKTITTHVTVTDPAISIIRRGFQEDDQSVLLEVLDSIAAKAKPGSTVYLLARFKFKLPDDAQLKELNARYASLVIALWTFHRSKGKEAEYVVILGLENGPFGFPSTKETHPLLEALLPIREAYAHAEERRLFYVALTRAKHRAYLLSDMTRASAFITELIDEGYDVELDEFKVDAVQQRATELTCPVCKTGRLRQRDKDGNTFYGCSNFPLCTATQSGCSRCREPMKPVGRYRICVSPECKWWEPLCPRCGAQMKLRKGPFGRFWGCTRWTPAGTGCDHKEQRIESP